LKEAEVLSKYQKKFPELTPKIVESIKNAYRIDRLTSDKFNSPAKYQMALDIVKDLDLKNEEWNLFD
jgi:hypothetical protein